MSKAIRGAACSLGRLNYSIMGRYFQLKKRGDYAPRDGLLAFRLLIDNAIVSRAAFREPLGSGCGLLFDGLVNLTPRPGVKVRLVFIHPEVPDDLLLGLIFEVLFNEGAGGWVYVVNVRVAPAPVRVDVGCQLAIEVKGCRVAVGLP